MKGLRRAGCTVQSLAAVGQGCPDIVVGLEGRTFLFELKNPDVDSTHQKLTPLEAQWHAMWKGQVTTATSAEAILTYMRQQMKEAS